MPLPLLPRNINDPTAQDVRERALIKEFKRRIDKIGSGVKAILDRQQPTSITLNALDIEVKKYEFNIDEAQYDFLGSELDSLIDRLILEGADRGSLWLMTGYVQPAYQQGTAMAWGNLKVQSKDYRLSRPDLESILTSAPYRRRLGYIKSREFEEMKGLSAQLKKDYRFALLDGMAQGMNPLAIADKITQTTGEAITRTRRVARTEITTALKRARLDEAEDTSERLGLKLMMMQISALSPTTRASHAARHAKLYTLEQVRAWMSTVPNMIACKCTFIEVLVNDDGTPFAPGIIARAEKMRPDDYEPVDD